MGQFRLYVSATDVRRMYESGMTMREIATAKGCTKSVIERRLKETNTPMRPSAARLMVIRKAAESLKARKPAR